LAKKEDVIVVKGAEILEKVFAKTYKVKLPNGAVITAKLSGKLSFNKINIIPGDHVTIELSVYDLTNGRITYREKLGGNNES